MLHCGSDCVDWKALASTVMRIERTCLLDEQNASNKGATGLVVADHLWQLLRRTKTPPPLPLVLMMCQCFASTDPRDKIFALLNLAADLEHNSRIVDYSKPVDTVYLDVMRSLLTSTASALGLLYFAGSYTNV